MFLQTDDKIQNCIILEDDFQFILPQATVNYMLDKFFNDIEQFDILMLSYNSQGHKNTNYNYLIRIDWAFSLSGYCVNKQYARRLLENYKNGAEKLEYEFKNTGQKNREYYIDVYNQQLICESIWYGFIPRLGKQIQSYSDIEKNICRL